MSSSDSSRDASLLPFEGKLASTIAQKKKRLLRTLKNIIEPKGPYQLKGNSRPHNPGLHAEGYGIIGLPVSTRGLQDLEALGQRVELPARTTPDYRLFTAARNITRSYFVLDKDQIQIRNEAWTKHIQSTVSEGLTRIGVFRTCELRNVRALLIPSGVDVSVPSHFGKIEGCVCTFISTLPSEDLTISCKSHSVGGGCIVQIPSFNTIEAMWLSGAECSLRTSNQGPAMAIVYDVVTSIRNNIPIDQSAADAVDAEGLREALDDCFEDDLHHPKMLSYHLSKHYPNTVSIENYVAEDKAKIKALAEACRDGHYAIFVAGLMRHLTKSEDGATNERGFEVTIVRDKLGASHGDIPSFAKECMAQDWNEIYPDTRKPDEEGDATHVHGDGNNRSARASDQYFQDTVVIIVPSPKSLKALVAECSISIEKRVELIRTFSGCSKERRKSFKQLCQAMTKDLYGSRWYRSSQDGFADLYAIIDVLLEYEDEDTVSLLSQTVEEMDIIVDHIKAFESIGKVLEKYGLDPISSSLEDAFERNDVLQLFEIFQGSKQVMQPMSVPIRHYIEELLSRRLLRHKCNTDNDAIGIAKIVCAYDAESIRSSAIALLPQLTKNQGFEIFLHHIMLEAQNDISKKQVLTRFRGAVLEEVSREAELRGSAAIDLVRHAFEFDSHSLAQYITAVLLSCSLKPEDRRKGIEIYDLDQLAPLLIANDDSPLIPLLQHLICYLLATWMIKRVGKEPKRIANPVLGRVRCACTKCQQVNKFLENPHEEVFVRKNWTAAQREHVESQLDPATVHGRTLRTEYTNKPYFRAEKFDFASSLEYSRWERNLDSYKRGKYFLLTVPNVKAELLFGKYATAFIEDDVVKMQEILDTPIPQQPELPPNPRPKAESDARSDTQPDAQPNHPPDPLPKTESDPRPDFPPDPEPKTESDTQSDAQPNHGPSVQESSTRVTRSKRKKLDAQSQNNTKHRRTR